MLGERVLAPIEGHNRVENYLGLSSIYSEQSMDSYAAYLQDEWQLTEKLFFVPSVRWDHFRQLRRPTFPAGRPNL